MKKRKLFLPSVLILSLIFIFSISTLGTLAAELGDTGTTVTLGTYNGSFGFTINRTDGNLFDNLDEVMPGDILTKTVTVKSDSANSSDFNIYLYALPGDETVEGFLSGMTLQVFDGATEMPVMNADSQNGSKGVLLGQFSPGSSKNLELKVTLPLTMGDAFQGASSIIEWHFYAEEIVVIPHDYSYPPYYPPESPPVSPSPSSSPSPLPSSSPSPTPPPTTIPDDNTPTGNLPGGIGDEPVPTGDTPQTGDSSSLAVWIALTVISGSALTVLLLFGKKERPASGRRK
ncbi:MAG: LPXTG cell wall anchor domain-containing protein [Oscillospiraceae bacterium]